MIDPIAMRIGFFSVSWYSLMYILGFTTVWMLLVLRTKKGEWKAYFSKPVEKEKMYDFFIFTIIGLIVGARIGYVLFYNAGYYISNPLEIVSPYDFSSARWTGIYGMSYHGGVIGVAISSWVFCRKNGISFWKWFDFLVPAVPAGYFFGRIGNFLNGELFGRETSRLVGMYFPGDMNTNPILRHPSQLYEAILEGILLFIVLWSVRNKRSFRGFMIPSYLFGYGLVRFAIEYFREPDYQLGLIWIFFTMGQLLSLGMIIFAALLFWHLRKKRNADIISTEPKKVIKIYG